MSGYLRMMFNLRTSGDASSSGEDLTCTCQHPIAAKGLFRSFGADFFVPSAAYQHHTPLRDTLARLLSSQTG